MLLTVILAVVNIFWAGFTLSKIILPEDPDNTWLDWLSFLFFLGMGIYFMVAMIGEAAT